MKLKKWSEKKRLPENVHEIRAELKREKQSYTQEDLRLKRGDKELLKQLHMKTSQLNINNITRTKAYLDFYVRHPEIHWAFLGHMVSRNGGWNMTDLRGEFLSRIINEKTRQAFFSFLERGNWLIFQDAYPQFLLYEESKRKNRNLFYLLPYLNVSKFMKVIWNAFWKKRDPYLLAMAQIINEQNYLEGRIVQNPLYKQKVFYTLEFVLQDLLSFNHILFPSEKSGTTILSGLTLHHFGSLHERIMLGKKLYSLLFHNGLHLEDIFQWATIHPHTASRKDYWPHIFNDVDEGMPGWGFKRRLTGCRLRKNALRLYSPRLEYAWKDVNHKSAEGGDWFNHLDIVKYLIDDKDSVKGEIGGEYCETLERLELAALAKKAIFI